mgnify:CR=1 FL=1
MQTFRSAVSPRSDDYQQQYAHNRVLIDALAAGGDEAKRAFDAMMPMKKIDVATIEAARRG